MAQQEGDGLVVQQPDEFAKAVLPKYYKHSNYPSFVRQVWCGMSEVYFAGVQPAGVQPSPGPLQLPSWVPLFFFVLA